ncbi:MAG: tetratricopeptide repeat protein [Nitrospiraceae bacterium]
MKGVFLVVIFLLLVAPQHVALADSSSVPIDPAPSDANHAPQKSEPAPEAASQPLSPSTEESLEALRHAVTQEPDNIRSRLKLALALADTGETPDAILQLRAALKIKPDFTDARVQLVQALYQIGDVEAALEEAQALVQVQPDVSQAHLTLATVFMAKQDWRGALAELHEALRLDDSLVQAHYNLGMVHYTMGNRQAAIQSYGEALRLKPDFPDAHYHLGLVLKLTNRAADATEELRAAAESGMAKAQYFLGNAYRSGQGIEKNLPLAISWWVRAAEQGMTQASDALAQLRQTSASRGARAQKETHAAVQAFADYQNLLWQEFPDFPRAGDEASLGVALLKAGQPQQAIPVLIREAYTLNEAAQTYLEKLYEDGAEGQPPYDARILRYFHTTAAEGLPRSRLMLAQIYAKGLGVSPDPVKAKALLKGFSKGATKRTHEEPRTGKKGH